MSNQLIADLNKLGAFAEQGLHFLEGITASTPEGATAIATAKQNLASTTAALQAAAPAVETAVIDSVVAAGVAALPAPAQALAAPLAGDIDNILIGVANGFLAMLTTKKATVAVATPQ